MKNLSLSLLIALLALPAMAQTKKAVRKPAAQPSNKTSYTISGTCTNKTSKVYILDFVDNYKLADSVAVNNGKFTIKGTNTKNTFLAVGYPGNYITIINDGQPITVNIDGKKIIKASELNRKLNGYQSHTDSIQKQIMAIYSDFIAKQKDTTLTQEARKALSENLNKQIIPMQENLINYDKGIITSNKDNIIAAFYVSQIAQACSLNELKEYLDPKYSYTSHPITAMAKNYMKRLDAKEKIIGAQFIDIEEADTTGTAHKLSEYCGKGNYVLIDFWASWCGPCRGEMPNVKENYKKYHENGFEIIGLSFDNKADAWKNAINTLGLNWIHLSDLKGWQSVAASTYNIDGIPASLLVDPQGKIVARDLRGEDLGEKLKEIYGF